MQVLGTVLGVYLGGVGVTALFSGLKWPEMLTNGEGVAAMVIVAVAWPITIPYLIYDFNTNRLP